MTQMTQVPDDSGQAVPVFIHPACNTLLITFIYRVLRGIWGSGDDFPPNAESRQAPGPVIWRLARKYPRPRALRRAMGQTGVKVAPTGGDDEKPRFQGRLATHVVATSPTAAGRERPYSSALLALAVWERSPRPPRPAPARSARPGPTAFRLAGRVPKWPFPDAATPGLPGRERFGKPQCDGNGRAKSRSHPRCLRRGFSLAETVRGRLT